MRLVGILIDVCIKKKKNDLEQPKLNPGQKDLGGRSARCFRTRTCYCSQTLFKTKLLSFWAGRQMDTKPRVTALILTPKGSHIQREADTTAGRAGRWKETKSQAAMQLSSRIPSPPKACRPLRCPPCPLNSCNQSKLRILWQHRDF